MKKYLVLSFGLLFSGSCFGAAPVGTGYDEIELAANLLRFMTADYAEEKLAASLWKFAMLASSDPQAKLLISKIDFTDIYNKVCENPSSHKQLRVSLARVYRTGELEIPDYMNERKEAFLKESGLEITENLIAKHLPIFLLVYGMLDEAEAKVTMDALSEEGEMTLENEMTLVNQGLKIIDEDLYRTHRAYHDFTDAYLIKLHAKKNVFATRELMFREDKFLFGSLFPELVRHVVNNLILKYHERRFRTERRIACSVAVDILEALASKKEIGDDTIKKEWFRGLHSEDPHIFSHTFRLLVACVGAGSAIASKAYEDFDAGPIYIYVIDTIGVKKAVAEELETKVTVARDVEKDSDTSGEGMGCVIS